MKDGRGGAPTIIPEFRDFRRIQFEFFQRAPAKNGGVFMKAGLFIKN